MSVDSAGPLRASEREESGFDIGGFLARRKWLIMFGLLAGLGLGYLKFNQDPEWYRSTGRVFVTKQQPQLAVTGVSSVEPMGLRPDLRNDIELIMSETIIGPAITGIGAALQDDEDPVATSGSSDENDEAPAATADQVDDPPADDASAGETNGEGDSDADPDSENSQPIYDRQVSRTEIKSLVDLPTLAECRTEAEMVARIANGLKVSQVDVNSSVLLISFEGPHPEDCGAIINNVIRVYQRYLDEAYQSVTSEGIEYLTDAERRIHDKLKRVEEEILSKMSNAPPGVSGETNIHQTRMAGIETERSALMLRQSLLRTQLGEIDAALAANYSRESILLMVQQMQQEESTTVDGQPRAYSIAQEIFPLLLEEANLLERFGDDHPAVINVRRQIEMTRSHLEEFLPDSTTGERLDFLDMFVDAMELEQSQIAAQLTELNAAFDVEEANARELLAYTLELQNLQAERDRLRVMWDGWVTLLQSHSYSEDHGEYRADVIALAGSGHKIAPNLYSSLPIGGILGMLGGILLAVIAEAADKSFKTPGEIAAALGIRVIGHTPVFPKAVKSKKDKCKLDTSLVAHYKPKSRSAEAFRAIRTALYFSSRGNQHRVIQMTSPDPRDGKSTITANLAISIAQSGKRTLLVDADFRRPRVHHLFGLKDDVGVTSVIAQDLELPEAIQSTEVENLDCLPCGPRPDNPAELLTSAKFDELLAVLKEKYDFVLVDSPPILAVTDPGAIASRVDGVLLVLRINAQARHAATQSVEILRELNANMLGIVVNGVDGSNSYGYRGYGYGYAYGEGGKKKSSAYYAEAEARR